MCPFYLNCFASDQVLFTAQSKWCRAKIKSNQFCLSFNWLISNCFWCKHLPKLILIYLYRNEMSSKSTSIEFNSIQLHFLPNALAKETFAVGNCPSKFAHYLGEHWLQFTNESSNARLKYNTHSPEWQKRLN